ncbi:unnamed protein product [Nesidiocoris tenuis]|uniref:FH2 domain-containing protein n=1 Tax=Nesidiocoris tenuis TaxID=355587 RepID=A0A6H5HRF0_9HEMI|nr:unnamed protein product [Nesidiocoris tenuis]
MEELENVRKSLAEFFCEDPNVFKLEECFKVFHGFCLKFKQAVIENEKRRLHEEQMAARRRQREEQLAVKRRTHITPTGSLRRRRSRVPSEEDDASLMDFLRSSGHDGTRERKSWGSLESEGRSGSALDTLPEGKLAEGTNMQYKRVYPDWRTPIDRTDVVGAMEAIAEAQPQSPVKDKSPWRKSNLNVPNTSEQTEMDVRRLRRLKSRGSLDVLPTPNLQVKTGPYMQLRYLKTHPLGVLLNAIHIFFLQSISEEEKRKEVIRSLGQNTLPEESLPVYIRCPSDSPGSEREQLPTPQSSMINKFKAGKISPLLARRVFPDLNDKSPVDEQTLPPFAPRRVRKADPVVTDKVEIDSDNIETPPASRRLIGLNRQPKHDDHEEPFTRCSRLKDEIKEEEEPLGDGQFDRFSSTRRTRRYRKNIEEEAGKKGETSPEEPAQPYAVEKSSSDKEMRLKKWKDKLTYRDSEEEALADINKTGEELKKLAHSSTLPRSFKAKIPIDTKDALEAIGKQLKETSIVDSPSNSSTLPRALRRKTGIDHSEVAAASEQSKESHQPARTGSTASRLGISETDSSNQNRIPEIRLNITTPIKVRTESEFLNDEGFEETQSLASETPSQGASSGNYEGDFAESPKSKTGPKLLRADSSGSGDTSSDRVANSPNSKPSVARSRSLRNTPGTNSTEKRSVIPRRTGSLRRPNDVQPKPEKIPVRTGSVTPSRVEPSPVQRRILTLANKQNMKPAGLKSDGNIIQTPLNKTSTTSLIKRTPSITRENRVSLKPTHCDLPSSNKGKKVERSSSRSSLRSSRSSLNSATSVSTVRPAGNGNSPEIKTYTRAIKSLTSDLNKQTKKPLAGRRTIVPASRSSSSGSSIGPTVRKPTKSPTISTSFKENNITGIPASRSSSSGSSIGPPSTQNVTPTGKKGEPLSFMRPTAASSAKDTIDSTRFRSTLRSIKFKTIENDVKFSRLHYKLTQIQEALLIKLFCQYNRI